MIGPNHPNHPPDLITTSRTTRTTSRTIRTIHIRSPQGGLLIGVVLMVLEVTLVFPGVVLVVPPQSADPSSTDPPTGL